MNKTKKLGSGDVLVKITTRLKYTKKKDYEIGGFCQPKDLTC